MTTPHRLTASALHPFFEEILGTKFKRDRGGFRPATVFTTIMKLGVLGSLSYRQAIIQMNDEVGEALGWENSPNASAFCQARHKLTESMCDDVYWATYNSCPYLLKKSPHYFRGLRLCAIDMTRCNLPISDQLESAYGLPKGGGKKKRVPQGTFTMIMDVGRNMPISWIMDTYKGSERKASVELCQCLGAGDLLFGDRGYPSRNFFMQLIDQKADFLIRLTSHKRGTLREVYDFVQSDKRDAILTCERHPRRKIKGQDVFRIRVIKMTLPDGETGVFATSLMDTQEFPIDELSSLYCSRWRIETAFREMKMWHTFEHMHAEHARGIYQEITALMIFMLLTAELEMMAYECYENEIREIEEATPAEKKNSHYAEPHIRWNRKVIAEHIVCIMKAGLLGKGKVEDKVQAALYDIWRYRQRIKRGRTFERVSRNPEGKWSGGRR